MTGVLLKRITPPPSKSSGKLSYILRSIKRASERKRERLYNCTRLLKKSAVRIFRREFIKNSAQANYDEPAAGLQFNYDH